MNNSETKTNMNNKEKLKKTYLQQPKAHTKISGNPHELPNPPKTSEYVEDNKSRTKSKETEEKTPEEYKDRPSRSKHTVASQTTTDIQQLLYLLDFQDLDKPL